MIDESRKNILKPEDEAREDWLPAKLFRAGRGGATGPAKIRWKIIKLKTLIRFQQKYYMTNL